MTDLISARDFELLRSTQHTGRSRAGYTIQALRPDLLTGTQGGAPEQRKFST